MPERYEVVPQSEASGEEWKLYLYETDMETGKRTAAGVVPFPVMPDLNSVQAYDAAVAAAWICNGKPPARRHDAAGDDTRVGSVRILFSQDRVRCDTDEVGNAVIFSSD
jgi:hypothetical protein